MIMAILHDFVTIYFKQTHIPSIMKISTDKKRKIKSLTESFEVLCSERNSVHWCVNSEIKMYNRVVVRSATL